MKTFTFTFAVIRGITPYRELHRDRWRVYSKRGRRIGGTYPTAERAAKAAGRKMGRCQD